MQTDITRLEAIAKAHPNSNLNEIIKLIGPGSDSFETEDAEYKLAYDLYPQSPNIMPKNMSDSLQSILNSLQSNPSISELNSNYSTLQVLLNQAEAMQPPSPQSTVIVNNLKGVMDTIENSLSSGKAPSPGAFTESIAALKFLFSNAS